MRRIFALCLLGISFSFEARAQLEIAPNINPYPFLVLANSTRQISVQLANTAITTPGPVVLGSLASGGTGFTQNCVGAYLNVPKTVAGNGGLEFAITSVSGGSVTGILPIPIVYGNNYIPATNLAATVGGSYSCTSATATGATVNVDSVAACTTAQGYACSINWSVASTTGGASATFTDISHTAVSSLSGAIGTVLVNIGATAGVCSMSPGPGAGVTGPFTVSSTATVTVQAQSVDTPALTANFVFDVCANATSTLSNGTNPIVVYPNYQQVYKGQTTSIQAAVLGCTDPSGTWSIVSQPGGASITLPDTTYEDMLFPGSTVTGRYVFQFASTCISGGTNTATVYVSPNALPSYTATPQLTGPQECYPDPQLTGPDYEVGTSGETYSTISSMPAIATWGPGTIARIHNDDLTGLSPTTYYEYFQVKQSGQPGQPIIVCGVPDSLGNLPIMDGTSAVGQAGISSGSAAGLGIISTTFASPNEYGFWQNASAAPPVGPGPNYVTIAGLHFRNAGVDSFNYATKTFTATLTYTVPGALSTTVCPSFTGQNYKNGPICNWAAGAECINVRTGTYIDIAGVEAENCNDDIFSGANSNGGWAPITQNLSIRNSHITKAGVYGSARYHGAYLQSMNMLFTGNLIDAYKSTATGSDFKFRGENLVAAYNLFSPGSTTTMDLIEQQDDVQYVDVVHYIPFWAPASGSYDTAGPTLMAWIQELAQNDYVYGNIIPPTAAATAVYYGADTAGGIAGRNGTLHFYNNTVANANIVFGLLNAGYNTIYQPRLDLQNNIFYATNCSGTDSAIAMERHQTFTFSNDQTNLFRTCTGGNAFQIAGNILGGSYSGGTANGWQALCDIVCLWPLSSPMQTHIWGLSSANFIMAPSIPYSAPTYAPVSGSSAISAGSALTGQPALRPVRYQYSVNTASITARTDAFFSNPTIGGVQGSPPPVLTAIIVTPSSASVGVGSTITLSGACTYFGSSTPVACTSGLSWASSNTGMATVDTSGNVTGVAVGTPNITASSNGVSSSAVPVRVYVVPGANLKGFKTKNQFSIK